MWGWFTGCGKTSPVPRILFLTASAMASAIPCRAPPGTLACRWWAVSPTDEVEAMSWLVFAGTWRSVAGCCCMFSAVSAAPRLRLETRVRYALLAAGLFPFGGILGGGRSGLITRVAQCAQNNSAKNRSNTRRKYIGLPQAKKENLNCINSSRWGRRKCLTNVMR